MLSDAQPSDSVLCVWCGTRSERDGAQGLRAVDHTPPQPPPAGFKMYVDPPPEPAPTPAAPVAPPPEPAAQMELGEKKKRGRKRTTAADGGKVEE